MFNVLLYYCYTPISDVEKFKMEHHLFCIKNNLKGRIIVSTEGINGTVSGTKCDCLHYMNHLKSDDRFKNIDFKVDEHFEHVFRKLNIYIRDEIVNSGLKQFNPIGKTGKYIMPKEFQKIKDEDGVVLVDVRSNYEHRQGTFKNAITLDINNFRDFPTKLTELDIYKDKKVITFCTGNIKAEKASALLKQRGFKDVYQLYGGIIKYGLETDGRDFEGECYVFDNRISIPINKVNASVRNTCFVCNKVSQRIVNCANPLCNRHVAICEDCGIKLQGACSKECEENPKKRLYNEKGYYAKKLNGYNPSRGLKIPKVI